MIYIESNMILMRSTLGAHYRGRIHMSYKAVFGVLLLKNCLIYIISNIRFVQNEHILP